MAVVVAGSCQEAAAEGPVPLASVATPQMTPPSGHLHQSAAAVAATAWWLDYRRGNISNEADTIYFKINDIVKEEESNILY